MSNTATGVIIEIYPTQQVSEKFKKREFVLQISEEINGQTYTNFAKFQTVQARTEALDRFAPGQAVTVHFNIKGNKWERDGKVNYITNLEAWKVEAAQGSGTGGTNYTPPETKQPAQPAYPTQFVTANNDIDPLPF